MKIGDVAMTSPIFCFNYCPHLKIIITFADDKHLKLVT